MRFLKGIVVFMVLLLVTFFLFSVPFISNGGNEIPYDNPPFAESQWKTVSGIELHFRHFPQPEAKGHILLIHGFCGSTYSWRKTIPALEAAGYEVLAVDLPAFGYSSRRRGLSHHNVDRGKLLWELIDTLGLDEKNWVLTGHSMGGGAVMAMATLRPEYTSSLILVGGAVYPLNEASLFTRSLFRIPLFAQSLSGIVRVFFFNKKMVERLLTSAYGIEPAKEDVEQYLKPLEIKGTALAVMDLFNSGAAKQKHDYQPGENFLLIWGDQDDWVPIESAYQLKEKYPQAKLVTFEDIAHNPMESHPELFNPALLEYLDSLE